LGAGIKMNERYHSIDLVKFFAIFAVVCGHTRPFENTYYGTFNGYYLFFIINTLARFSVPFFFIASGFLLGKKIINSKDYKKDFKNYFSKIMKIYICWTLFYIPYIVGKHILLSYMDGKGLPSISLSSFNLSALGKLLGSLLYYGYSGTHLWYLVALVWCVVIIFIFNKISKIKVLLIISLGFNILGLFGDSYKGILHIPIMTRDALFFGLFYCTLGYYIAFNESRIQKFLKKPGLLVAAIACFSLLILAERIILVTFFNGDVSDNFFICTIPMSVAIFLFALAKREMGKNYYITKIGKNSLGIYVIHLLFLDMSKFIITIMLEININIFILQILLTPIIFVTSYLGYQMLQTIKKYSQAYITRAMKGEQIECLEGVPNQFK
jgi:surface polysaccharide O-acyltransferase-like enzyme